MGTNFKLLLARLLLHTCTQAHKQQQQGENSWSCLELLLLLDITGCTPQTTLEFYTLDWLLQCFCRDQHTAENFSLGVPSIHHTTVEYTVYVDILKRMKISTGCQQLHMTGCTM